MDKTLVVPAKGRARRFSSLAALGACTLFLAGCGGGAVFNNSQSSPAAPSASPSLTDRFGQLFGGKSQEVGAPNVPDPDDTQGLTCPPVNIRHGASTLSVGTSGQPAVGADLRYQATITRTARDCSLNSGQVTARIGIQGRVIVGPAGAPTAVDIPMRVAVVQEGVNAKTIMTKVYQTRVEIATENSVLFSIVGEDIVYPAPKASEGESYVFYIGFDPQALRTAPAGRKRR